MLLVLYDSIKFRKLLKKSSVRMYFLEAQWLFDFPSYTSTYISEEIIKIVAETISKISIDIS